jgi:predicted aconitase
MGGTCCVPTTQDPASIPFETWEEMGFDREYAARERLT